MSGAVSIVALLLLIGLMFRYLRRENRRNERLGNLGLPPIRPAREVLDRRYAEGEIGRDEYWQIRRDLEEDTGREKEPVSKEQ